MISHIIFDFDGTIGDTMSYNIRNLHKMLEEEGGVLTKKEILNDFKSYNFFDLLKKWRISILRLPFILKKIKKLQEDLYYQIQTIKIFPGMEKLFKDLKKAGFKLGILSSNLQKNVDKFLEIYELNYFDIVYGDPSFLKKDQSIKYMLKKNNLRSENIVYVGDEIRDIIACHKLGIKIICVPWGLHHAEILKKNGADYLIKKPSEILQIINYK